MVSKVGFQRLTDPGHGDPYLVDMGLSLRQVIQGVSTYTLTGLFRGKRLVTVLTITVTDGRMLVDRAWRGLDKEFSPFSYDRVFAIVSEAKAQYPDAEFPGDNYWPDYEIPWEGEPMYNEGDDDLGLEARG